MTGVEDDELCDVDWRLSLCYYHSQMMVRHRGSVRDRAVGEEGGSC